MTLEIYLTLGILIAAIFLFITEKIRMDVVALLVLVSLAVLGLVSPEEAISGFSNPAVVTVWAVFVLSGGLSRTGVANLVGNQIVRLAGTGEVRLIILIMVTASIMSAFMNNVGVVALMLPVVVSIARRTGLYPSRLLMPLLVSSMFGGMMTLISTPPNILASNALRDAGLVPFGLFDFTPIGAIISATGILFMVLIGRHLLPVPKSVQDARGKTQEEIEQAYLMSERLAKIRVPEDSSLVGKTLMETRLSAALGITVLAVKRNGDRRLTPLPTLSLQGGDLLTVAGRLDFFEEVRGRKYLEIEQKKSGISNLVTDEVTLSEISISPHSNLIGKTLRQLDFRRKYGGIVLAVWRDNEPLLSEFDNISLLVGDLLLVLARRERLTELRDKPDFLIAEAGQGTAYHLEERLQCVSVPEGSPLVGKKLSESHLAEVTGLAVLGICRDEEVRLMVEPEETTLMAGDKLFVKGRVHESLEALRGLQSLLVETSARPSLREIETDESGMLELVLSPHSNLPGSTLGQIEFRGRYELNVIAIFREGRAYRSNLSGISLRYGDAILVHGSRDKLNLIALDSNFISLVDEVPPSPRITKAPLAIAIMLGVVFTVLMNWLPISVAAIGGSLLMVLTGCLTMDEAYREIEWRAVFLIAGMLPLGIAMDTTGTARMLADLVVSTIGSLGVLPMIAGLFLMTVLASQVMPNAVVVVLMAPVALVTATNAGLSPYAVMMVIAMGASVSFLTPVGHPANLLVMAPGGYRFKDYLRIGLPLLILITLIMLFVLPLFWRFT